MASISTSVTGFAQAESTLLRIPDEMDRAARKALRAMGKLVVNRAKQLAPPPGYPGDKEGFKPLRDTIAVEVKQMRHLVAIIGPKSPAGAHGHLVEYAHRHFSHGEPTGTMTQAQPFLGPASRETRPAQDRLAANAIREMDQNID